MCRQKVRLLNDAQGFGGDLLPRHRDTDAAAAHATLARAALASAAPTRDRAHCRQLKNR